MGKEVLACRYQIDFNNMRYRYAWIAVLLAIAIVAGFVQEYVKVNINYVLEMGGKMPGFFDQDATTRKVWIETMRVDAPYDYYHNHSRLEALYSLSEKNLVILKWVVTVVFVTLFMVINTMLLFMTTRRREVIRWTLWLYLFFFVLSFGVYLFGWFTGTLEQAYGISRKIVGGLQSMVPLMLLLPATWLMRQTLQSPRNEKSI
jgi:hypothetical protein